MERGSAWPPEDHQPRLDLYARNKLLWKSGLNEVFCQKIDLRLAASKLAGSKLGETCAILLDYPRLMSLVVANLLVGESPIFSYEEPKLRVAMDEIVRDSSLKSGLLEAALATSYRGDGVLIARRCADGKVRIEGRSAAIWFPELDADNNREVRSHRMGWLRKAGGRKLLRIDEYRGGEVRRRVFENPMFSVGRELQGSEAAKIIGGPVVLTTGLTAPPIVHIPNLRLDDEFFGESDYTPGLITLFGAACNRISNTDLILDKHADPKMAGAEMDNPNGDVDTAEIKYFDVPPGAEAPSYITWDGKLDSSQKQLDQILDQIYIQSEISKILIGYVIGARYESSRAVKLQFIPTLAKVARKRTFMECPLSTVIRMALALKLGIRFEDVPPPEISWRDGLPADPREDAETEGLRVTHGLTSRERAIQRLDECTAQDSQDEIARMMKEQSLGESPQIVPAQAEEVSLNGR